MSGQEQHHSPAPPPLPQPKGRINAKWICVSVLLPLLFGLVVPYGIYHMQKKDAEHQKMLEQKKADDEKKKQEAQEDAYDRDLDVRISLSARRGASPAPGAPSPSCAPGSAATK